MKYPVTAILLSFMMVLIISTPVKAQTETPPAEYTGPTGVVTGKLVNQSKDGKIPVKAELMVHIWDQTVDKGMVHGETQLDGTFSIEKVPLEEGSEYLAMAVYQDVTYSSQSMVYKSGQNLNFEIPIKETTTDISQVQVDQMHALFNLAVDGLEVKEIYILSNNGDRTVKNAVTLSDKSLASFQFPLPADADYIFFKPDSDSSRFVKFPGGFADKGPLLPGEKTGQFMVSYLVPFNGQKQFTYTAPLNIKQVDLLVPADSGINLSGAGLGTPETTSLQDGANYFIYSILELQAGKTITFSISAATGSGSGSLSDSLSSPGLRDGIIIGGGVLGLAMVLTGAWWVVKHKKDETNDDEIGSDIDSNNEDLELDDLIAKIAKLDEAHNKGGITADEYHEERNRLMKQAKELMV